MQEYQRSQRSRVQELHRRGEGYSVVRRPPLGGSTHPGDSAEDASPRRLVPWNESNRRLTEEDVIGWLRQAGVDYVPKNLGLFQQAMTHPSYTEEEWPHLADTTPEQSWEEWRKEHPDEDVSSDGGGDWLVPLGKESYNTLEFLGDSVLNLCVVDHLTQRYPKEQEGFLTKLKIRLVCGSQLSVFTQALRMQDRILISWLSDHEHHTRENLKVLEDVMEAFLGALFLDSGRDYVICSRVIEALLERCVNFTELVHTDTNYKDQLLRYYAAHFYGATPRYHEIRVPQDPGNVRGVFVMGVLAPPTPGLPGDRIIAVGEHKNKKRAEQMASKKALAYLGVTFTADRDEAVAPNDK